MTGHAKWAASSDTLVEVARKMRDWRLRLLPIRSEDERLVGVITDRDIVIGCVADGTDPTMVCVTALAQGSATAEADDSLEDALWLMLEHGVRQLPVVDDGRYVGMISQADIARNLPPHTVGRVLDKVSNPARGHWGG